MTETEIARAIAQRLDKLLERRYETSCEIATLSLALSRLQPIAPTLAMQQAARGFAMRDVQAIQERLKRMGR